MNATKYAQSIGNVLLAIGHPAGQACSGCQFAAHDLSRKWG
jgi:hypothetical protein